MNKRGVSLAILVFTIASIVLLGLSLTSFYLRDREINKNLGIYNDVDKIYIKKVQLNYYLDSVFERSVVEGGEGFVDRFREDFLKWGVEGFEEVEEYINSEEFVEDIEWNEEKLVLKFEVVLVSDVGVMRMKYDYSRVLEKTFKV